MDGQRFDAFAKSLAETGSRRRVLKGLVGAVAGAAAAAVGLSDAAAALRVNAKCEGQANRCPANTRCTGRPRRCRCVDGTEPFGGRCVAECTGGRVRNDEGVCVCPTACAGGQEPDANCVCVCPAARPTQCPDANGDLVCTNIQQGDRNNCGACGADDPEAVCPATATCVFDGTRTPPRTECVCPGEQEICPTANGTQACIDPATDRNNCGGCGVDDPQFVCGNGETCVDGVCE